MAAMRRVVYFIMKAVRTLCEGGCEDGGWGLELGIVEMWVPCDCSVRNFVMTMREEGAKYMSVRKH
jgi:hypothetical protein